MGWLPDLPATKAPIYRAIAEVLARDIDEGRVLPGDRLPPQRELARRLGIDLTTVTRAYAEAAAAGLTVSEGRRGTFVRERAVSRSDDPGEEVSSGMNMPPEPDDGLFRRRLCEGVAMLMQERAAPLHYQPVGGTESQRAAAAAFLSGLIPETSPDQCIVTAGSQHALHALVPLVASHGERVAVGGFTYPGFLAAARRAGVKLVHLPIDEDGIRPDALERAAAQSALAALYIVPTNDNPTTATLPLPRRREIATLARRFGFAVIEDDAYGRLPEHPIAPVASIAPERTWHIATTSKLLSPSLRVGFVRAPTVRDALALAAAAHETAGMAPPVNAALVARWLDDGTFQRLLAGVRAEARVRMAAATAIFGPSVARWHPDGYHLWLRLDPGAAADRIAAEAVATGLPVVASSAFAVASDMRLQALRVSLGGSASRQRVKRELERLRALIGRDVAIRPPLV
ncbi:PLP-dependent aminotransferase family protein [Sphingosinicella sp. CPCC 101087]|uniref:aminotransferase-like domain-containing protein n=1 Tax=Sphingosinicella sp. CPCC 101087 TaxID=2497754 RepID=UPI00101CE74D|nr:PLP-dependent aminotransferase family protein [Sphingosinicella sp. CPCC 101087]